MTKAEFQGVCQATIENRKRSREHLQNASMQMKQFDPQVSRLIDAYDAADDALVSYLKSRIEK